MSGTAVWAYAQGLNERDTALQATQRALNELGTARPSMGIVFVSQEFSVAEALNGVSSLLGALPLWGLGTTRPLIAGGEPPRSVVVALIAGSELKADVRWFANGVQDNLNTSQQLTQFAGQPPANGLMLMGDGISGDITQLLKTISNTPYPVAGGLAAGEYHQGKTYQIAGNQSGSGALAALGLRGKLQLGTGAAHGWHEVGAYFEVTRARGVWVQTLDNKPAAEAYAQIFGYPAREWAFPPLSNLVRLYPLGVEAAPDSPERVLRSPLHVEVDGSLRMNMPIAENHTAHLMVGDTASCLQAAQQAAQTALASLGSARPLLALAMIDAAWQTLFGPQTTQVFNTVQSALGGLPLIGAYTFGQIIRTDPFMPIQSLNQHIEILILGESE